MNRGDEGTAHDLLVGIVPLLLFGETSQQFAGIVLQPERQLIVDLLPGERISHDRLPLLVIQSIALVIDIQALVAHLPGHLHAALQRLGAKAPVEDTARISGILLEDGWIAILARRHGRVDDHIGHVARVALGVESCEAGAIGEGEGSDLVTPQVLTQAIHVLHYGLGAQMGCITTKWLVAALLYQFAESLAVIAAVVQRRQGALVPFNE